MKKSTLSAIMLGTASLTACTTLAQTDEPPAVGMANPASVFCLEQGGKLIPKKDKNGGEYALCHLPDGQIIEEWIYFHQFHKVK